MNVLNGSMNKLNGFTIRNEMLPACLFTFKFQWIVFSTTSYLGMEIINPFFYCNLFRKR
jgi:hypothetical protein